MIPKIIHTAWFGDEMPDVVKKSIASQKACAEQFGYEHILHTEESLKNMTEIYISIALSHKKWVKATDALRAWKLYWQGGIFLDADQEILPDRNFDDLLDRHLFASREENGFIGYSLVGSEAKNPLWEKYFQEQSKFTPLDGKNFESSMEIFTKLVYADPTATILTPDFFFPYNHQTGIISPTENTRTFHHFMKTWTDISPDLLPTASILLPTLGRPEGLKRALVSIDRLLYPKHLMEVIVLEGEETVPQKVDKGFKQSKGDYIVYASNDMEFYPLSLYNAIKTSQETKKGLVSFNSGVVLPDEGNINEHFVITRNLANQLGHIFDTDFQHVGVDNLLWHKAKKIDQAIRDPFAFIKHNHFSRGSEYDDVYKKGWENAEKDRELLKTKLKTL